MPTQPRLPIDPTRRSAEPSSSSFARVGDDALTFAAFKIVPYLLVIYNYLARYNNSFCGYHII